MHITTLGIDLAKNVFQLHGVDARGRAVLSRCVKRSQLLQAVASLPPCVIGMEAGGSAHHWGRTFEPLGHTVKLMHPKYVKPYVKTNKNDGRDAEASATPFTVQPIVVFPGWYVERTGPRGNRDVWVLNPKMLAQCLEDERSILSPALVDSAANTLTRYSRWPISQNWQ